MISLFNKKSITGTIVALCLVFMVGCSSKVNTLSGNDNANSTNKTNTTNSNESSTNNVANTSSANIINTPKDQGNVAKQNSTTTNNSTSVSNKIPSQDSTTNYEDIAAKVKDYILNGQGNKSSAESFNWNPAFLNQVDMENLYKKYIASGGQANNVENFAKYITFNAPVPSNWKELFEKTYYASYGKKISRYEYLGNDLYQVYVVINGKEVPYVAVSSRTGNYHG
ncbi:hypothetical protein [Clostridium akagii]|uniref:hypothetical protein n=1 Tax=Clostridium akagii TaxID=91623 RepID=UPI00068DB722|nr:hypothetical protein [Clostridium akagii]